MIRTTVILGEDLLRRTKVQAALTDQTVSAVIAGALEKELADLRLPGLAEGGTDAWAAMAEPAFDFWNNDVDSIYDNL